VGRTRADARPQDDVRAALPALKIAVIGAGIGGLGAGIALKLAGFADVAVYEQAHAIEEVGAGIQVRMRRCAL
jgi:2-polyprenyl-6-methoxyphenol hydroxylase-like FAD-dependent oxidoreductase